MSRGSGVDAAATFEGASMAHPVVCISRSRDADGEAVGSGSG